MKNSYVLNIEWHVDNAGDLPSNVGPFATREEAVEWGTLNIPNGSWEVWPLARPYADPTGQRGALAVEAVTS